MFKAAIVRLVRQILGAFCGILVEKPTLWALKGKPVTEAKNETICL